MNTNIQRSAARRDAGTALAQSHDGFDQSKTRNRSHTHKGITR